MTNIIVQQAFIGIASSFFELYLFTLVYSTFWSKKSCGKWIFLLFYGIYVVGGFAVSLISDININVIWSLLNCFLAASFYQNKLLHRLVISILFFVVANSIENATGFLLSFFSNRIFLCY